MTLYEFIGLGETEKANAVWSGNCIAIRNKNGCKYLLFDLGEFFVEVEYSDADNKIVKLKPFKTKKLLEPYLDFISIKDVKGLL